MKKTLILAAMVMGANLAAAPILLEPVSVVAASATTASDVRDAVAFAQEVLAETANAKGIDAERAYLQRWVNTVEGLTLSRVAAKDLAELKATLEEGARGVRMMAGASATAAKVTAQNAAVAANDATTKKTTTDVAAAAKSVASAAVAGDAVAKTAANADVTTKTAAVKATASEAKAVQALAVEKTTDDVAEKTVTEIEKTATKGAAFVATLAQAQVADADSASDDSAPVEVPATGAQEIADQAASQVRGMGLFLGGAVVLAAAMGTTLIVKRLKRGL